MLGTITYAGIDNSKDPWKNVDTEIWEAILTVAFRMSHVTVALLDSNETQLHFDGPQLHSQGALYKSLSETFGPTMDRRVAKKLFTTVVNCSLNLESVTFRVGSGVWVFQKDYGVKELSEYFQVLMDSDLKIRKLRIRELLPIDSLLQIVPPLIYRFRKTLRELEVDHVMQGLWHVISLCENLADLSVAYPEGRRPRDLETALAGKFLKKLEVVAIQGLNARGLSLSLTRLAEPPVHLRIVNCPDVTLGTFLPLAPAHVLEHLRHLTCESGKLPLAKYDSPIKETAIEEENSALKLIPRLCPNIEEIGGAGTLALGLIKAFLDRYCLLTAQNQRKLIIRYADHITLREFAHVQGHGVVIRPHILLTLKCDEALPLVSQGEKSPTQVAKDWSQNNIQKFYREKVQGESPETESEEEISESVKFTRGSAVVIGIFLVPSAMN